MSASPEGFAITRGKGFHMTFANGWTISVQFGPYNYCDHHDTPLESAPNTENGWTSRTAEVAVWDGDNNWMEFDGDTVAGYKTADEVAALITKISRKKSKVTAA